MLDLWLSPSILQGFVEGWWALALVLFLRSIITFMNVITPLALTNDDARKCITYGLMLGQVVCFAKFCSADNPAKYPPVMSGMYLLDKYSKTHQDFDANQGKN